MNWYELAWECLQQHHLYPWPHAVPHQSRFCVADILVSLQKKSQSMISETTCLSKFCDMISCWFFPKPVIRWAFFWRVGKTTGPGFLKPSQANPEIANILISVLYVLGAVSRLYCLSSGLSLKSHKLFRTLAMKKTFYTRKMETSLNF